MALSRNIMLPENKHKHTCAALRGVHLLSKCAEGFLQGLVVAGQLLKGFHADPGTPHRSRAVRLPLQSRHPCLQSLQLSLALALQCLHSTLSGSSTAGHSRAQQGTAQHSAAQHSAAQHRTAQHSTAQHHVRACIGGAGGQRQSHSCHF